MIKGSLQVSHGTYYVVVNYKDEYGKPKQKWISTELREKGNKTKAKQKMKEILKSFEINQNLHNKQNSNEDVLFVDFLKNFLAIKKAQLNLSQSICITSLPKIFQSISKIWD